MNEDRLRTLVGLFLVISHFVIALAIALSYGSGGILFDQMVTSFGLILPLFAGYATIILKYFIDHRHDAPNSTFVTFPFAALTLLVPVLYVLFVLIILALKSFNVVFGSFEQFKTMLGVSETIFAVYVGMLINALFIPKATAKVPKPPSTRPATEA